ncbi:MAG: hypothetical protein AB7S61_02915 [Methanoregulaceae archaeon]
MRFPAERIPARETAPPALTPSSNSNGGADPPGNHPAGSVGGKEGLSVPRKGASAELPVRRGLERAGEERPPLLCTALVVGVAFWDSVVAWSLQDPIYVIFARPT